MKAKTFLILWMIGFLFVAPKWIPALDSTAKAKETLRTHAGDIQVGKTLGFVSVR